MINHFFLYGTLMKGEQRFNYPALVPLRKSIQSAKLEGAVLYDLGEYPAMILHEGRDSCVHGELHEFTSIEKAIKIVDRLERFNPKDLKNSLFRREEVTVTLGNGEKLKAWAYVYNQPLKNAKRIPSGDWRRR